MRYLFILPLLAACASAPQPPEPPRSPARPDTCGAARYENLIGQDATALERVLIMGQVRVIRPGMAVTKDYRPARINFDIGTDNRILRINCG